MLFPEDKRTKRGSQVSEFQIVGTYTLSFECGAGISNIECNNRIIQRMSGGGDGEEEEFFISVIKRMMDEGWEADVYNDCVYCPTHAYLLEIEGEEEEE